MSRIAPENGLFTIDSIYRKHRHQRSNRTSKIEKKSSKYHSGTHRVLALVVSICWQLSINANGATVTDVPTVWDSSKSRDQQAISELLDAKISEKKSVSITKTMGSLEAGLAPDAAPTETSFIDFESAIKQLSDPNPWRRQESISALAEFRGNRAVIHIIEALEDVHEGVRETAAWSLGKMGDPRAVPPLNKALGSANSAIRQAAAWSLGKLGDKRAVEPLIASMQDSNSSERYAVAGALAALNDKRAVQPLIRILQDSDARVRKQAIWSLLAIGDSRVLPLIVINLEDADSGVREAVVWAIYKHGGHEYFDSVSKLIGDANSKVRIAVLRTLEKYGKDRGVDFSILALNDMDANVRKEAIVILARNQSYQPVIEPLINMLGDPNASIRSTAKDALTQLGEPLGQLIFDALEGSPNALKELIALNDPRSLPSLRRALRIQQPGVRRRAANVLGDLNSIDAIDELARMAGGWNINERIAAMKALAKIKQRRVSDYARTLIQVIIQPASIVYALLIALSFYGLYAFIKITFNQQPKSTSLSINSP